MASTKVYLYSVGVALCVGFGINSCSDPVPETKIVTVPTVKVVTRTVEVKVPVPAKTAPALPQSCLDAIALVAEVGKSDSILTEAAGTIKAELSNVERNALRKDAAAMNKSIGIVSDAEDRMGNGAHLAAEKREDVRVAVGICQLDLASR